jgi:hypothetical protein
VIERALRTCHALAAYVTPDFHGSWWTDQEVGWALGRGVPVIPISVGVQPYGFIGAIQAIQVGQLGAWTIGFQVFRAIALRSFRGRPPRSETAAIVARTVVRAVCDSPSYDGTRQRVPLLDLIPPDMWTPEMIDELEQAPGNNSQIGDATLYGPRRLAPQHIRDMVARLRAALGP